MDVSEQQIYNAPILIVDDSVMSLERMKDLLIESGFTDVYTENDPTEVVERYHDLEPTLVILDYYMPEMNGEEVLDALKEEYSSQRLNVLFWTTAERDELYKRALEKGAKDVLRKEIDDIEIIARVENLIKAKLYQRTIRERNQDLHEKVLEKKRELKSTSVETIYRLSKAAEFRDKHTGAHTRRIGLMTHELAKLLKIDDSIADAIRYAAPLHDVGKLAVPDNILLKPSSLNDEEWTIMKKHTKYGGQILSNSDRSYIQLSRKIALYHHEQWDGNGYPEGLSGNEIPIEARITAVCDVFDAVLSSRPYKDPWDVDEAIELIKTQREKQLDPNLTEVFLENIDRMLNLREQVTEDDQIFDPELFEKQIEEFR